jgi:hypothetical protein
MQGCDEELLFEEMERIHVGIFYGCKDDIQRRRPF